MATTDIDTVDTTTSKEGGTKIGNTRKRSWFFTLNNPLEEDFEHIKNMVGCIEYAFQKERGAEGTEHFQGFWRFANAVYFNAICKQYGGRIHIEAVRSLKHARAYCSKEDTRIDGPWIMGAVEVEVIRDPMEGVEWHPWQIALDSELLEDPDDRKIIWYVDREGGRGKTTYCKHLCIVNKRAHYLTGGSKDVKFAICQMELKPKIILWDMPRSLEYNMSYEGLEAVKNGIFFSGKYEAMECIYNVPHLVVFANWPPQLSALSSDRWDIRTL